MTLRKICYLTREAIDQFVTQERHSDCDFIMEFIMEIIGHGDQDVIEVCKEGPDTLSIKYDYEEDNLKVTYDEILEKAKDCLIRVNISSLR